MKATYKMKINKSTVWILSSAALLSGVACVASPYGKKDLQSFNISEIISKVELCKGYKDRGIEIYFSNPKMVLKNKVFVSDSRNVQEVVVYGLTKVQSLDFFNAVTSEVSTRERGRFLSIEFKFYEAENFKTISDTSKRDGENLYFAIIYRD